MRRFVSLCVAFVLALSLCAAQVLAYSRTNATNYADTYVFDHNPNFRYFTDRNCTNFVSQCMHAVGVPMTDAWYYHKTFLHIADSYSLSWTVANELKNYVKNDLGALRLVSKWRKVADPTHNTYAYIDNSSNITNTGIEIVFYDWQDNGNIDHSSIVVGTGTSAGDFADYGDLIDQNSYDRKHVIWNLDKYNTRRWTTAIYAFRLS